MGLLEGFLPGESGEPKIKNGITGQASVMGGYVPDRNASHNRFIIMLTVRVEGREPYLVKHKSLVPSDKTPWDGMVLPVTVDQKDSERLRIEWDQVPSAEDRIAQRFVQAQEGAGGTVAGTQMPGFGGGQRVDLGYVPEEMRSGVVRKLTSMGIEVNAQDLAKSPGTPAASENEDDTLNQLEKLGELRKSGVLTEAEFQIQKAKILGG